MINTQEPNTWQELETEAARILSECGMEVERGRELRSVRGTVNVDVYAVDRHQSPPVTYVCECKHWEAAIPKSVVHSFRSVMADTGANVGFLISRSGFQSGAVDAADKSNVRLITWPEFEALFEKRWIEEFFCKEVRARVDPLCSYTEPLPLISVDEKDVDEFWRLHNQRADFGFLVTRVALGTQGVLRNRDMSPDTLKLPLSQSVPQAQLPEGVRSATSFRTLLDAITTEGQAAIAAFRRLNKRTV